MCASWQYSQVAVATCWGVMSSRPQAQRSKVMMRSPAGMVSRAAPGALIPCPA